MDSDCGNHDRLHIARIELFQDRGDSWFGWGRREASGIGGESRVYNVEEEIRSKPRNLYQISRKSCRSAVHKCVKQYLSRRIVTVAALRPHGREKRSREISSNPKALQGQGERHRGRVVFLTQDPQASEGETRPTEVVFVVKIEAGLAG